MNYVIIALGNGLLLLGTIPLSKSLTPYFHFDFPKLQGTFDHSTVILFNKNAFESIICHIGYFVQGSIC